MRPPVNCFDRWLFYCTAFICGATVMMIEILGTRIIGPFYGVSIIVWTSLLSTALLALAAGYLLGGRLADTAPWLRLSHILLLTGILIGMIPFLSKPVQIGADFLGLRWGAFTSALILFAPSLMGLGMIGPYVIKTITRGLDRVGRTVGTVYAISTIGSVFGTILLGFYLLPVFGTVRIVVSLSVLLLLMALLLSCYERLRLRAELSLLRWTVVIAILIAGLIVATDLRFKQSYDTGLEILFEQETAYGWVRVLDDSEAGIRWLTSGGSTIGVEELATGRGLFEYLQVVGLLPLFNTEGSSALLVGLGAGHLVNIYNRYGIMTDSIEIDPVIAMLATKYFSFEGSGDVMVGDARRHIQTINRRYDFIIHDSFTGGAEPIHLMTLEMFRELKARLKPGGILVLNMVGINDAAELQPMEAVAKTLDSVFAHRRTFISTPESRLNDFLFFVSDQPLELDPAPRLREPVDWLLQREIDLSGVNGRVITDDFNPLDILNLGKAEAYREVLVERIGRDHLFK